MRHVGTLITLTMSGISCLVAQGPDVGQVVRGIDQAVQARVENVAGFTDVEHYAVYRGANETHPAAEMTVKPTYRKGAGKSYEVLSQSGSALIRKFGLLPLLDNEKTINLPGNVERSWFTSANYEMNLKSGGIQRINGRNCFVLTIQPKRKAPNAIAGTLWVDAIDDSIVQIDGVASQNPSLLAGTTHMMRQYANVKGFPMSTHARAESNSAFFGKTVVTIEYGYYELQLVPVR